MVVIPSRIACSLPPQLFFCDSPSGDPPTAGALQASAAFLEQHMVTERVETVDIILTAQGFIQDFMLEGGNNQS